MDLKPIFTANTKDAFLTGLVCPEISAIEQVKRDIEKDLSGVPFYYKGFCLCCDKLVNMLVDFENARVDQEGVQFVNWRERLVCPSCQMSNRQRLISALIKQFLSYKKHSRVYFMESVTPIFSWAKATFRKHKIIGSEYLGSEYKGGAVIKGIRHEDVMNLSFKSNSIDLIVSNDVFEHVPDPLKSFQECYRVLRPGGVMLATMPFYPLALKSIKRAKIQDGSIEHLLPPEYHGNPVSEKGALVFTDFGWDVFEWLELAGFDRSEIEIYASEYCGHLGDDLQVFRMTKKIDGSVQIDSTWFEKVVNFFSK